MNTLVTITGACGRCGHAAARTNEPWNNQYRCDQGCRCTMQGCCPSGPWTRTYT